MVTSFKYRQVAITGILVSFVLAVLSVALPADGRNASATDRVTENEKQEVAAQLATLFRSARAVISENQALINDETKGDKGLTGEFVVERTKENYAKAAGTALNTADDSLSGRAVAAMLESVESVMNDAQPLINEKGKGFKGFLPAIFAKQVADTFTTKMKGSMAIKLTAPKSYVRNRANRPDSWEHDVLEQNFKSPDWVNGEPHFEQVDYEGTGAFRFILPEYYKESCLKCHGGPKGELDVTGGKKEGGVLGELGGAISVVIFD
ncbi:MAG: DUF3365 domain-containing protein [Pirellulales bacterium]|nr:DUF3365 domain-containing protein [Pirellulales bacterium]